MSGEGRQTYTVHEVAKVLGIGRTCAYEGVRTGAIPSIKIGGRIVIPREVVRKMLSGEVRQPERFAA
jgi:excisionase family DNA binding protein